MFKFVLIFCLLAVSYSLATPSGNRESLRNLPALQHEEIRDSFGQYAFRYVTAEGSVVSERGRLIPSAAGGHVMVYEGETTHLGPDGKTYVTRYSAGPDGVKIEGDHLPRV